MDIAFLECSVQGLVVRAICATMEVPPNDDQSSAPAARQVDLLTPGKGRRPQSYHVRIVPTQKGGRFVMREVLEYAVSHASTENWFLEYVLMHFQDINGEWVHSNLFKESQAMQDVEAMLYFPKKMPPDMCYRLV